MKVVSAPSLLLLVVLGCGLFPTITSGADVRQRLSRRLGSGNGKTSHGKKGKGEKDDCTHIEFFSDNALFGAAIQGNAIGTTVADLPIFSRTDTSKVIGEFTLVSTDLNNPGGSTTYEDGFVTLFADDGTVAGTVFYMGLTPSGNDFAITGGIGAFACAQGVLKFQGFEADKFNLDVVLCGGFCDA